MASGLTTVQITREASTILDAASRTSKLPKSYLATTAVMLFFDPERNPKLREALAALASGRQQAEQDFLNILENREGVEG